MDAGHYLACFGLVPYSFLGLFLCLHYVVHRLGHVLLYVVYYVSLKKRQTNKKKTARTNRGFNFTSRRVGTPTVTVDVRFRLDVQPPQMVYENIAGSWVIDSDSLAEVSVFFVALSTNAVNNKNKSNDDGQRRHPPSRSGDWLCLSCNSSVRKLCPQLLRVLEFLKTRQYVPLSDERVFGLQEGEVRAPGGKPGGLVRTRKLHTGAGNQSHALRTVRQQR